MIRKSMIYSSIFDEIPNTALTDKCIVLDLDETLVHSCEDIDVLKQMGLLRNPQLIDLRKRTYRLNLDDVLTPKGQGIRSDIWGITRPHLNEFLAFCFSYFRIVAVWSAGQPKYVESICDFIFRDLRRPHIIYSWPDCEKVPHIEKPLQKMIESEPAVAKYMNLSNTFVIDDKHSTFAKVNPKNAILIPRYEPALTVDAFREDEPSLMELKQWFSRPEVTKSKDIRTLDKSKIFSRAHGPLD